MIRLGFNAKTSGNRASVGEKSFLTIFAVVCLLMAFSTTVSANPGAINVPGNYTSIKDAINNANETARLFIILSTHS